MGKLSLLPTVINGSRERFFFIYGGNMCSFMRKLKSILIVALTAGALCVLTAVLWIMQLIWSDRKGSPMFAVP